jgi:hypothetical protein
MPPAAIDPAAVLPAVDALSQIYANYRFALQAAKLHPSAA